jgi:ferredoxin-fold anticodon binding domain-containing protein
MNIYINSIVKVYNDKRLKLGIIKEIRDDYVMVQGIFSRAVNVNYRVKIENVEPINLLEELNLQDNNMLEK